MKKPFQCLTYE